MERWFRFTGMDGKPLLVCEGSISTIVASNSSPGICYVRTGSSIEQVRASMSDLALMLEAVVVAPATASGSGV